MKGVSFLSDRHALIIKYEPFERSVQFILRRNNGDLYTIEDGNELKDFENEKGRFSLEAHQELILNYICENFSDETEFALNVEVSQAGSEAMRSEFEHFRRTVARHNKENTPKIVLEVIPPAPDSDGIEQDNYKISIAVIGKESSGKTELIKGMIHHLDSSPETERVTSGVTLYSDKENGMYWYEIEGISIVKRNAERVRKLIDRIVHDKNISIVLYCFHSKTGNIEPFESSFIVKLKREHPAIKLFAVITECVDDIAELVFARTVHLATSMKVLSVLATKSEDLEPFGLDDLFNELK